MKLNRYDITIELEVLAENKERAEERICSDFEEGVEGKVFTSWVEAGVIGLTEEGVDCDEMGNE